MPPFTLIRLKAAGQHGIPQNVTVLALLRRYLITVGPAAGIHEVENRAHIQLLMGLHIHQRQIHGLAAGMTGTTGDVTLVKHLQLFHVGIMDGLAALIGGIFAPAAEIIHGTLRTISVKELHHITLFAQDFSGLDAALGSFLGHDNQGLLITVGRTTHKVVGSCILCVDDAILNQLININETLRQFSGLGDTYGALIHFIHPFCLESYGFIINQSV